MGTSEMGWVVFKEKDLKEILKAIAPEIKITQKKYLKKNNEKVVCESCKKTLRLNNIGNILPEEDKETKKTIPVFLCKNIMCFIEYWTKKEVVK